MSAPNWAEQVTAIATAIGAIGLVSAIGATIFAARQVQEAQHSRQAQMATDFLRRWNDEALVETRRLVATFKTREELASAFQRFIANNDVEAYILYRELDFFEQLGAAEETRAVHFELIQLLLGAQLVDRYDMWKPSIDAMGAGVYPMFGRLAAKVRRTQTT